MTSYTMASYTMASYTMATSELHFDVATFIAQRELRNNNANILNRVEAGESFVVTRNGVAVADLVPHTERSRPPMFPKTVDLAARRTAERSSVDREAWLRDIRDADKQVEDDPLNSRA